MKSYKAVIFDLDGTLVDSAPALMAIGSAFLGELGAAPLGLAETRAFIGDGARVFCERALAGRGLTDPAAFAARYARFLEFYAEAPGEDNAFYPTVRDAIEALAAAGVPLGLCTNKPGEPTRKVLSALDLDGVFEVVVTGDTLPQKKPDPAPLLHAVAALGFTPSETLFVGDSEVDAEAAHAAGCDFALHLAGYARVPVETLAPTFAFDDYGTLISRVLRQAREAAPAS